MIHYTATKFFFNALSISYDRRGLRVDVSSGFIDTIGDKTQMSKTMFMKSQFVYIFQYASNICNSVMIRYDVIYLLTANGSTSGGNITVHSYTQTVDRTTK